MGKKLIRRLIQIYILCLSTLFAQTIFLPEDQRTIREPIPTPDKTSHIEKLSSELNTLYQKYINREPFAAFADQTGLRLENNMVEVTILLEKNFQIDQAYLDQLKLFGIQIKASAPHSLFVQIPLSLLTAIIDRFPGIVQIRRPLRPKEHAVTSEGVVLMNADTWHSAGHEGAGVKVAVIDGGFSQLTEAQAAGDIPSSYTSYDFTGDGLQTGSSHGTAVSEAIYDVAPQAELYLYKIGTFTDFENAKDACIANGVHIVNHSMGWFNAGGYYNGYGYVCDIASDAIAHHILWVNSAGNSAEAHYRADFNGDTNNYHLFGSGNINPIGPEPAYVYLHNKGDVVNVTLNWDNYPTTDQDYDMHLYRLVGQTWNHVVSSIDRQNGSIPPEEHIYHVNNFKDAKYGLVVEKYSATGNADFTLFSLELGLSYHTASSSITDPASVTDVITVGAIDRINYDSGPQEAFSSQGPTTDGRIKPDIMAPDNCISFAYGYWIGTSLSSPHTAGICAVIKSSSPGYSNTQIKNYLYTDAAIDLGDAGKDNIYGWGKIGLSDSPLPVMLKQFNASSQNDGILLEWTTASEINNAYWIIEKKGGILLPDFDSGKSHGQDAYAELVKVEGNGSTNSLSNYCYLDTDVIPATHYRYRLSDVSYSGRKTYHTSISATYQMPVFYQLAQNHPNPFNPYTIINYHIPRDNPVELSVYNLMGQKVATLVSEWQQAGRHQIEFDGSDMPGGIYFYRLRAGNFCQTKKMILLP
jgi:hypothetical protein